MTRDPIVKKEINPVKLWIIISAIAVIILIAGAAFADYYLPKNTVPETQIIKNIFVDINGDGLIDFISEAKVILNTGVGVNFP